MRVALILCGLLAGCAPGVPPPLAQNDTPQTATAAFDGTASNLALIGACGVADPGLTIGMAYRIVDSSLGRMAGLGRSDMLDKMVAARRERAALHTMPGSPECANAGVRWQVYLAEFGQPAAVAPPRS